MMKTTILVSFILATSSLLVACDNNTEQFEPIAEEESAVLSETLKAQILSDTATLLPEEVEGLMLMREEEKMAHDVYSSFYDKFGLRVFANIANSESKHMEAVLWLINSYKLTDPASNELGVFENADIQNLYNKFMSEGVNEVEALKIGAFIEEYDIADLEKLISETGNMYIVRVYTNLLNGSKNHLRAFVKNLSSGNVVYQPSILSQTEYAEIIGAN
ncbi:ferritin [Dysgonamonadaceae bacterium]|nr:ferritin [Dysgonamonadaceae bacterium]